MGNLLDGRTGSVGGGRVGTVSITATDGPVTRHDTSNPTLIVSDRTALEAPCVTCGGDGCESGCGLHGGCAHAYDGPDSHRIHAECRGRGVVLREFVVVADAELLVPCPNCDDIDEVRPLCDACQTSGTVPASVGSTHHDVEITERGWAKKLNFTGGDGTLPRPFAHARTVHVVARERVKRHRCGGTVPWHHCVDDKFVMVDEWFDALPAGDPLYVIEGIEVS